MAVRRQRRSPKLTRRLRLASALRWWAPLKNCRTTMSSVCSRVVRSENEMTDFLDRISALSPKRLALLALEQHDELESYRAPIAVVGIGCRFPGGVDSPDAYWKLLREGRDAIREVPRDRWNIGEYYHPDPDEPGRISARSGGFLDSIDGFEPEFFGISPREARTMDPQQRMALEVAWEALEHAA